MRKMFVPGSECEIKVDSTSGQVSGYASIFGNVDLGGDIIVKDSPFKEFVHTPEGKTLMLYSHDSGGYWTTSGAGGVPIGKADIEQNAKGLKFDGLLTLDDEFVRGRVYPGLKSKTINGMSIGYDILPGGGKVLESGIRELSALKLWEISVCVWGMNPKASIDTVKAAQHITNERDFEDFLREAGFSKAQAVAIASGGWKTLQTRRDSGEADDAKKTINFLTSFTESLQK